MPLSRTRACVYMCVSCVVCAELRFWHGPISFAPSTRTHTPAHTHPRHPHHPHHPPTRTTNPLTHTRTPTRSQVFKVDDTNITAAGVRAGSVAGEVAAGSGNGVEPSKKQVCLGDSVLECMRTAQSINWNPIVTHFAIVTPEILLYLLPTPQAPLCGVLL